MGATATSAGVSVGRPEAAPREKANSPGSPRRREVFDALNWLSRASTLTRVQKCRRVPQRTGVPVSVVKLDTRAYIGGVQTCGSVWACPACSERVLAGRREELEQAVERWAEKGGRVAMVTLTMRHDRAQELAALWSALGAAWEAARTHRRPRALLRGVPWVRRIECTVGENGWHLHVHALLFVGADWTHDQVQEVGAAMFGGWRHRLVALGFAAPEAHLGGLDARLMNLADSRREIAGYLAKGIYEAAGAAQIASELASAGAKIARAGNRSTLALLADCVAYGLADDVARWHEWERASKGRCAITWARGARVLLLGSEDAPTDDELAELDDVGGRVIAMVPAPTWQAVLAANAVCDVLDLAEQHDDPHAAGAAVVHFLAATYGPAWWPPDLGLPG